MSRDFAFFVVADLKPARSGVYEAFRKVYEASAGPCLLAPASLGKRDMDRWIWKNSLLAGFLFLFFEF